MVKKSLMVFGIFLAIFTFAVFQSNMQLGGLQSITSISARGLESSSLAKEFTTKIIPAEKIANGALFDVLIKIPEKSKNIRTKEKLLVSVELFNFGDKDSTEVFISYIITDSKGEVELIEHEERVVNTQDSFLKEIDISNLRYGNKKLFVEMLYSNTSATGSEEFTVLLY